MEYLTGKKIRDMDDNALVYVNRNTLNATIAKYEIGMEYIECTEELQQLLTLWNKIYMMEMENKRIEPYVKMKIAQIKKCFKNYQTLPKGSKCLVSG